MANKKIILFITFFILAVFAGVEKVSADCEFPSSCGNGGQCICDLCPNGQIYNSAATDKDCNKSGGFSERCCEPVAATCQNTGDMCGASYNNTSCCNGLTCAQGSGGAFTCQTGVAGGTCPGSCQAVSCGAGQDESQGPFTNCSSSMHCCVSSGGGNPGGVPSGNGNPGGTPSSALTGSGVVIPENTGLADPPGGIAQILDNLLLWLLGIVGIIALIGFVISGIQYIISTGDETMMERAKRNMMYSIAGIAVALSGVVVVMAISNALEARWWF